MDLRKTLLVKSLRELLTITACLIQNKCKPQISKRKSTNLPKVKGTSGVYSNLRCILKSHKIRSTFYTDNTMHKLLCKLKDPVATEDKNNMVHEINYCSNCKAGYFGESKWSLKNRVQMNTEDLSRIAFAERICEWFVDNRLSIHFGEDKTKSILVASKHKIKKVPKLKINYKNIQIKQHSRVTYLGCILDETMSG